MSDQDCGLKFEDGKIVYACGACGATGVRLWRNYQTFLNSQTLTCRSCSEKDQDKVLAPGTDQIGWRIPAVPTGDRDTFWGYTSVPDDGVKWWDSLPE